ncbi:O-antigen ligase family protein [uncultured Clostridium sp.]|jgi:putative inorganic carbon (HCO3(-)) transporter|uniref:O-antigen ligase family protein n=1 Tax=uncultured Clostridium sp. TaxID=59620 RepID=UPI00338FF00E
MNSYKKILYILLLLYIIIYPILPTYGMLNADIILYILALVYLTGLITYKKERQELFYVIKNIFNNTILLSISCLNLLMYLSVFIASDKRISLTNSIRFSMYIFIFYLISYKIKSSKQISIILKCFVFTSFLSGIYSLLQIGYTLYLGYSIDPSIRIPSFLENSNNLSAYSILSIFIVLSLLINSKTKKSKILYLLLIGLLTINIVFSQSRSALLAIILGFLLFAVLWNKKFLIISFLIPLILFIIPQSRVRFMQIFDATQNSSRFNIWEITKLMIKDNPIFGVGYENFSINYPNYVANNPSYAIRDGYIALHPHNIFLKIQVELGILGSIIFIVFLISIIYTLYKLIKLKSNSNLKVLIIGFSTSFATFMLMNLIDCYLGAPKVMITFILLLGILTYFKNHPNIKLN